MPDLEHNMDDLFRKAAEHYPLSSGGNDWDAVAAQLVRQIPPAAGKNKKKKFGATLLLLLLFLFTSDFFVHRHSGKVEVSAMSARPDITTPAFDAVSIAQEQVPTKSARAKKAVSITRPADQEDATVDNPKAILQGKIPGPVRAMRHEWSPEKKISTAAKTQASVEMLATPKKTLGETLDEFATRKDNFQRKRGIYIGLVSGPEFNEVKSQGFKKSGFDVGVIAGFQFNRRLSAETGIFFSRKYYFSDGSHFNMEMPGMKVLSLDGNCNVLEMPLKLRFVALDKRKMNIFSSAGISSYLLTSEKNDYVTLVNGIEQSMEGYYKKPCRYFAATFDLSIGYEHTLGTSTRLRIEPYLQIPLKGIGVGAMPVKSAGLHIGLLRSIR